MRLKGLTAALIGLSVLCSAGCGSSRKATSSLSEQLRVESLGFFAERSGKAERRDSSQVERTVVLDTLREVTTITVQVNESGDTLRQSIVTDRLRSRDRSQLRDQRVETKIVRDTVYVEKRDSVYVSNTNGFGGLTTGLTNPTNPRASPLTSALKWIFWIICAIIGLIIVAKVCLLKR